MTNPYEENAKNNNGGGVWDKIKKSISSDEDEFNRILELLKPKDDVQEIKSEIQKLHEEIEKLKNENKMLKGESQPEAMPDIFEEYRSELDEYINSINELMIKIFEENKNKVDALTVCIAKTSDENGNGISIITSACWKSIEELDEERFAAACEVFTNPRRIAILKILAKGALTASEIGQRTGLAGGQLYHHLGSLENSSFIRKVHDKYENTPNIHALLISLYACLGGMMKKAKT